ncbi:phosphoadenosine phosphosulfate reductase, partial [Streptomyces rimosus subsp. pseudoverticillatus]
MTSLVTQVKTFSFGGGWQSMAALVLAATRELDYRTFLMANVGDDSEHPGTLRYLRQYAIPY